MFARPRFILHKQIDEGALMVSYPAGCGTALRCILMFRTFLQACAIAPDPRSPHEKHGVIAKRQLSFMRSQAIISSAAQLETQSFRKQDRRGNSEFIKPWTVQIFYGSLDTAAMNLLANPSCNLYSKTEEKGSPWRFDLFPYGYTEKDTINRTYHPRGKQERLGNTVHQCALEVLGKEQALSLITCMMTKTRFGRPPSAQSGDRHPSGTYVYPGAHHKVDPNAITNFKLQVQDFCVLETQFQPRWRALLENCTNDPVQRQRLENHYKSETLARSSEIDGQFPAVFVNGTLRHSHLSSEGICGFLD
jgi:hypothetical protein